MFCNDQSYLGCTIVCYSQ